MKRGKSAENRADSETFLSFISCILFHKPLSHRKPRYSSSACSWNVPFLKPRTFAYLLFRIFNELGRPHKAYFYFLILAHLAHLTTGLNKQINIQVSVARVVVRNRDVRSKCGLLFPVDPWSGDHVYAGDCASPITHLAELIISSLPFDAIL